MSASAITIEYAVEQDAAVLHLAGAWRLRCVPAIVATLRALVLPRTDRVIVDGSRLESIDTAGAFLLLARLMELGSSPVEQRRFDGRHERVLELVKERMRAPFALTKHRRGVVHHMGRATVLLASQLRRAVEFTGLVAVELAKLARRPALFRPRETAAQLESACVDAIPIVALVNFLIGIVVAYVLGVEAQRYGASLFVADGIALAVCRELSPILASVLVAGRSGAAFAAEIGTMKVEEEVDAIATLGLSPVQVLVIPRLLALGIALPLLVLVGDVAGVVGGMFVGASKLHIPPNVFLERVHSALEMRHFVVGLAKAPVFALFIGMIACRMGLEVKGDARSVGRNTTSTVVQCIVWVFVLDAGFAVLFQRLGI